ncbi:MAG TPA: 3-hydroxyacyl-CoA dehydrogenase NAD-binding domain-containing protein, partial [Thermoanaerobaculia bacterium]|nr:3-hydroxyacyl-CoA dehydrogenase NAD-binding domain-containing protein [Thermoanaerobaculia bacterium]
MKIKKVGVLGCGLMGAGIVEVSARAGYTTVVREVTEDLLEKGIARLEKSLERAVEKGKLDSGEREQVRERITGTVELDALADCDLVVEAIVENLEEKRRTFASLDRVVKDEALFASNTSSL